MSDIPTDAAGAHDRDSWLSIMDVIGEAEGYFQTVGPRHRAMFVDDGTTLIVSFETVAEARARPGQMPFAHGLAAANGWSHLCLIADGQTFFRDPAVYAYFDRLVDDAFFEDFDRVLFYGAGPASYAAAAFAVAAPGAQVLLLNPVATLTPAQASWDPRFVKDRRLDCTTRYGFAPDMVEGAAHVALVYDPRQKLDAMHAALFHAPYATHLLARRGGADLASLFARMDILNDMIVAAMTGHLTEAGFARLWRKRQGDLTYVKQLAQEAAAAGRVKREVRVVRHGAERLNSSRFRKRLAELAAKDATGQKR